MSYKLYKETPTKKIFKVKLPYNEDMVLECLKEYQQKIKMDGYRSGKVPLHVLESKYKINAFYDVLEEQLKEVVNEIVEKYGYKIIASPKFEPDSELKIGKDTNCKVTFEIHPEVNSIKWPKDSIINYEYEITEKDIQNELEKVAKNTTKAESVEDLQHKIKTGDIVNINFKGFLNKEPFAGGEAENYDLEIGSKSFIDTFEDQLINKKKGDFLEVNVKFPKEYHQQDLSGKKAMFEVKINEIKTRNTPKIDEELAVKLKFENLDTLKQAIIKNMHKIAENKLNQLTKNAVNLALIERNDIEIPEILIEKDLEAQKEDYTKKYNREVDQKTNENMKKNVEDQIKLSYIFQYILKNNDIKVEDTDIEQKLIKDFIPENSGDEQSKSLIQTYISNPQIRQAFEGQILEEKIYDIISKNSKLKSKKVSFTELTQINL